MIIIHAANLLLMRRVSESLAGRASYLTLWPMTRREQAGLGRCGLWEDLLAAPDEEWLDLQELSSIVALPDFRRLMRAVCLRLGQLVNTSRLLMTSWAPAPAISNTSSTRSMACSTSAATTGPSTRRPPQPTSRMTALRLKRPHVATLDQVRISYEVVRP